MGRLRNLYIALGISLAILAAGVVLLILKSC